MGAATLAGCTYHDYRAETDAYEAEYAANHRYEVVTVPRGKHRLHARVFPAPTRSDEAPIVPNTIYWPSEAVIPPAAIQRFSTPGLRRDISVAMANAFDAVWQRSYMHQVGRFFCDDTARERYLKVFATHAREDRHAFFSLNRVLTSEVRQRKARVADMQAFPKPVTIIFGVEEPERRRRARAQRDLSELQAPSRRQRLSLCAARRADGGCTADLGVGWKLKRQERFQRVQIVPVDDQVAVE